MEEENIVEKTFAELGLREELVKACDRLGWKNPSKIQAEALPYALEGKDVIGLAQTGSGKTGAFALPILQALLEYAYDSEPKKRRRLDSAFFACVLSPTRELAIQIAEQFEALGSDISLNCAVLVGGIDRMQQTVALAKRPHVIICLLLELPGPVRSTMGYTDSTTMVTMDKNIYGIKEYHMICMNTTLGTILTSELKRPVVILMGDGRVILFA